MQSHSIYSSLRSDFFGDSSDPFLPFFSTLHFSAPLFSSLLPSEHSEIVTIIESTGAIGIYHTGYSAVSKAASKDYLDRVFVDMMWYKAFSVYLILRMKINVLFQDADLVWFKDPFPYFHNYGKDSEGNVVIKGSEHIEAFFSDDGQRSLRYSPFYANSGFYYLKGNLQLAPCVCLSRMAWHVALLIDFAVECHSCARVQLTSRSAQQCL
jgi:Nucleotide-diphospho-sugar transferase